MNGIHDMGGMQDMGPIRREKNEPVFHATWEGRVFALEWANPREWPYSEERLHIESIPPADYLRMSYYEKWLVGMTEAMVKNGMVTRAELESGTASAALAKPPHVMTVAEVEAFFRPATPKARPVPPSGRFQPKASVRARNIHPVGHTRLPRYARGKRGVIERDHGVFPFPDTEAHGLGKKPQHVYSVRFAARELWGEQAGTRDSVFLDLWEDYLEAA
jgi:nitrile hydratase